MTREQATDYRNRLRQMLFYDGIETILDMVRDSDVKKVVICQDYEKFGGGKTERLHGVSRPYISRICGCKKDRDN